MRFCDSHPLLFAIICMPLLIGGFLVALSLSLHAMQWVCEAIGNIIWESGLRLRSYWQLFNKVTIYYPEGSAKRYEPFFLPGAFRIFIKVLVFYAFGWLLHAIIFGLLT